MKRLIPLFIIALAISTSTKAEVVFGEVSGAECSTLVESENSAVEVFIHLQKEKKYIWTNPLKVYTEKSNDKLVTTIVYKAATRGPALPIGPSIQKQNKDAAKLGVSRNSTPQDKKEIIRVLKQHESTHQTQR